MSTTLGDRIAKALADADMTVQALADTLEEEGVEGGSYANLHRLKSDKMERPSAGLLYGIARATGVNLRWLVADDGEMTPTESRAAGQEARELLFDAAPRLVGRGGGPARAHLAELLRRLVAASPEDEVLTEEQVRRLGRHVERMVFAGLVAFHPSTRSREGFAEDSDPLVAALHALTLAVPDRGQGRTLEELLTNLEAA